MPTYPSHCLWPKPADTVHAHCFCRLLIDEEPAASVAINSPHDFLERHIGSGTHFGGITYSPTIDELSLNVWMISHFMWIGERIFSLTFSAALSDSDVERYAASIALLTPAPSTQPLQTILASRNSAEVTL